MSSCSICGKPFSWILRQHTCKNCLRHVCSHCGCYKRTIYRFDPTGKPHRCCVECVNDNKVDKLPNTTKIEEESNITSSDSDEEHPNIDIISILKDADTRSFMLWLSTFDKCWLRSKYPQYYITKQQELLELSAQPKLTKRKPKMLTKAHDVIRRGFHFNAEPKEKNPIVIMNAGTLWINIINAVNIPDCDVGSKPDCYIRYFITNNDTLFLQNDRFKYHKTKVQNNTFNPTWSEQKTLIITNTTGKLIIELWDENIMSEHALLGVLEIKLSSLFIHYSCSKYNETDLMIDDWFELTICDKWRDKMKKNSKADTNDTNDTNTEASLPVYEKLDSIPVINASDLQTESKCCIRLQLRLQSSWWAHFISHFDPVVPAPHKVKWSLDLALHELNLLQWLFETNIILESIPVLYWIDYQRSVVYLLLFTIFVYYPWFLLFCISLSALVYICNCYIVIDDKQKQQLVLPVILHWMCLLFGNIPTLSEKISQEYNSFNLSQSFMMFDESEYDIMHDSDSADEDDNESEQEKDEISMSIFGHFAAQKAIQVTGLKRKIWWIQELLVLINEAVIPLWRVINWHPEYMHITSMLCFGLFTLCILSVLCRETIMQTNMLQHGLYVSGAICLSYYSKPFQFMLWLICGLSYWYFNYYRRYQLFATCSVRNEIKAKRYYFVKRVWSQIGGVLCSIIKILFFQTVVDTKKSARCLVSTSKFLTKQTESKQKDVNDEKVKMRRHKIVKQFTGGFDIKFQYILSRLKHAKMLLF